MTKEKESTTVAPVAPSNVLAEPVKIHTPENCAHHRRGFASKEAFAAFLDEVKVRHPERWARQKDELEAALESF